MKLAIATLAAIAISSTVANADALDNIAYAGSCVDGAVIGGAVGGAWMSTTVMTMTSTGPNTAIAGAGASMNPAKWVGVRAAFTTFLPQTLTFMYAGAVIGATVGTIVDFNIGQKLCD